MQFKTTRQGFLSFVCFGLVTLIVLGSVVAQSTGGSAADLLQQGITLYEQGQYAQAQQKLERVDPVQLNAEQRIRFNATMEKVSNAKEAQTLFNLGAGAEQEGDIVKARGMYRNVVANELAPDAIRRKALDALQRLQNPSVQTADAPAPAPKPQSDPTPAPKLEPPTPKPAPVYAEPQNTVQDEPARPAPAPSPNDDLLEQARQLRVQQLVAQGQDQLAQGQSKLAEQSFQNALKLSPGHTEATQGLEQSRALAGREMPRSVLGEVTRTLQLRRQNAIARYDQAMDNAKATLETGNYSAAEDAVTLARTILDSNRQYLGAAELGEMRTNALNLGAEIQRRAEAARLEQISRQAEKVKQEKEEERERALKERDAKILELLLRARDLVRDQKYAEAMEHCEQVLFIDPNNVPAKFMRDMLEEQMLMRQLDQVHRQRDVEIMKVQIANRRDTIPHQEVLIYPPDWPQITQLRLQMTQGAGADTEANRRTRERLAQPIPVDFQANRFENVVEYLRNVTGVDIVPNWRALENVGIQRDQPVTLQMRSVPASKAMQLILDDVGGELVKLGYTLDDGVVIVATKEFLSAKTVIRAYDIRDLVVRVPDFTESPEFDLSSIATDDVGGQSIFEDSSVEEEEQLPRSELLIRIMDLIRNTVDPEGWRAAGGLNSSMEELNGTLIVNTTNDNHRQLTALLAQLREQRALQISIDGRFLFVTQNFLEEVGVDVDIAWNATNEFLASPVLIGNNTATMATAEETDVPGSLAPVAFPSFFFSGPGGNPVQFLIDDLQVDLLIRATQEDRRSLSVNTPRLTMFNGQRAYMTVSRQIAFVSDLEPVGSGDAIAFDPEIDVVSDGVVLDVEATISADRRYVTMTVRPSLAQVIEIREFTTQSISTIGGGDVGGGTPVEGSGAIQQPELQLTTIRTTVSVPDKGTLMLGGQRLRQEIEKEAGVPVLSKIPVINRLFTNRATVMDERTLLVLIKPTIIIQSEHEQQLFPGLEQGAGTYNLTNEPMP